MKIDRTEAMALARRKLPVAVGPRGSKAPPVEVRSVKEMPPEPGPEAGELEYHALRDPDGNWTREGLEHAIRAGGSVMHHGTIVERLEDLPTEEELAASNAQRLDAKAARIGAEMAKMSVELAKTQADKTGAEEGAKSSWKEFSARARDEEKRLAKGAEPAAKEAPPAAHASHPPAGPHKPKKE
jgi:hypothetical protein